MGDPVKSISLQSQVTAVSVGNSKNDIPKEKTFDAVIIGTGTVSATVLIEGSNNGFAGDVGTLIGTIQLSGSGADASGFYSDGPWTAVRSRVSTIAGTGATVSVAMGI